MGSLRCVTCCRFTVYHRFLSCKILTGACSSKKLLHEYATNNQKALHTPVMHQEVIEYLNPKENQVFIDMTFGAGGHSKKILDCHESIKLYALDRDPVAYDEAVNLTNSYPDRLFPLLGRFSELSKLLRKHDVKEGSIDGILIDAGCSSMQFDDPSRGFAISSCSPLDMRMDYKRFPAQPTAADVVNSLDFPSLAKIIKVYGEEKCAKKISQAIIDARFMMKRIETTEDLAAVVSTVITEERFDKLHRVSHAATKVFQALRIFVNNELNELNYAMELAYRYLRPGGRIVTLTFHSLEDRIVKRHIMDIDVNEPISTSISQKYKNASLWHSRKEMDIVLTKVWSPINKKVVLPSEEETVINPRSRSAKLRAAIKI